MIGACYQEIEGSKLRFTLYLERYAAVYGLDDFVFLYLEEFEIIG